MLEVISILSAVDNMCHYRQEQTFNINVSIGLKIAKSLRVGCEEAISQNLMLGQFNKSFKYVKFTTNFPS
jgi:hypothetical protein